MVFGDSKSRRALKLHHWLTSYCDFAGICQAAGKDYSLLWHYRNCKLTLESPQISTRRPQTPDTVIGALWRKCPEVQWYYYTIID